LDRTGPVAAIVGGSSLVGRELRDLLTGTHFTTKLIGADKGEIGLLTEEAGEPVVMTQLDELNLAGARVVFLAGSPESSRQAAEVVSRFHAGPALIDLTYALDDRPDALLRAPMAEPARFSVPPGGPHVIAHPASTMLAVFLARLRQIRPVLRSVAHVFEPASERGQAGVEELERQTLNLLTFKPIPKEVFDEQAGFNVLARFGSQAPEPMENIEARIERHLAALMALDGPAAPPSVRLIQVPVFHGHSVSLWAEFEDNPGPRALEQALASAHFDVRGPDLDPPNIIGMAGQSGIAAGAISQDRSNPRAVWFWIVGDNVRIMAENGVAVARSMIAHSGAARPQ
jgi:aspartate-semialdehyde dehydrogenase